MYKQNDAHPTAGATTGAQTPAGAIRRFYNTCRRWVNLIDLFTRP